MRKILMVPVHLDALYLSQSEAATEPIADFRSLPYFDKFENRDVNSDIPWLGEYAVSSPFENSNMTLQAGVHLHWALPDGLCHGEVVSGKLTMPAVPNRWLIRRRQVGSKEEKIWIVENDYLWPATNQAPAVNIFHKTSDEGRPYRFLGRKLTLDEWKKQENKSDEYLEKLTAIGYGEPTFAAFYPNCMTVFGFHDRDLPDKWETCQYDLLGWYGGDVCNPSLSWEASIRRQDLQNELHNQSLPDIAQMIARSWLIEQSPPSDRLILGARSKRQGLDDQALEEKVDTLLLKLTDSLIEPKRCWRAEGNEEPQTLVCYASIQIENSSSSPLSQDKATMVAVGNTISEALSALLAHEVAIEEIKDPSLAGKIEEQLEALYIEDQLSSEIQDLGLRLSRYRHQKSFEPVQGGERWAIRADPPETECLPDNVLVALRNLNDVQAKYSRLMSELEQARKQLYGDWCSYMRCVYRPPDSGRGQFLDIDEIVNYIETRSLARVEYLSGIIVSTGKQLEALKKELEDQIVQLNRELGEVTEVQKVEQSRIFSRSIQYSLQSVPGARFWQPNDPVVLMTGGKIQVNDRHSRDGRNSADGMLKCKIYDLSKEAPEAELRDDMTRQNILKWLEAEWKKHPPDNDENSDTCIGFRVVKERPWNPLFLDWGIDMHPAELHAPGPSGHYDSDIITGNYVLGSQNPDLTPGTLWVHDNPDRFSGRCILGDTSSMILKERIEDVLQKRLIDGNPELWAHPQDTTYHADISSWWNKGRPDRLPTTQEALKALLNWYQDRPLKPEPSPQNTSEKASPKKLKDVSPVVLVQDPLYCTLLAYKNLFKSSGTDHKNSLQQRAFLGQSLSGFNGELIQWKLGISLPINEPIGLTPYREFTQRVAIAVGDYNEWATEPTNNFSPIRSGILKLDKLRLINNFGQVSDISCDDKVIVPVPYKTGRTGDTFLPPRLVQPARVAFRWLDAKDMVSPEEPNQDTNLQQSTEMVEATARSPICGWLLPEKLRGRLLIFDGDGNPLGALAADKNSQTLKWERAPGLPCLSDNECQEGHQWLQSVSAEYYRNATHGQSSETLRDLGELGASLQNRRLARVLLYLWATRSPKFLECFLNTLNDAMANIDPEGTTSMGSLALLLGRPVAVVGAELDLQLKDRPAIRQDWDAFRMDQYRHERDTDEFEHVQFRLRLGQYQSRDDGVVGYWQEQSGVFKDDTFTAQAADDNDPSCRLELKGDEIAQQGLKAKINAHDKGDQVDDLNFTQSVADPPLQVTLLMDPRGKAHLTTGILPVKNIDIPRSLWEPALEAMRLWFPNAPILSRPQSRRVPIPALVNHQWSWLERIETNDALVWQTLYPRLSVKRDALIKELQKLNNQLGRVSSTDYDLILRDSSNTSTMPTSGKSLIIAKKVKSEDKQYLVSIFNAVGYQDVANQPLADTKLVEDLDNKLHSLSGFQGRELTQRLWMTFYNLILKGSQSTEALPTGGKNLVIANQINKDQNQCYLISIFDESGNQVVKDKRLTEPELLNELDKALEDPDSLNNQKSKLLQKIASNLGYGQAELILREIQSAEDLPTEGKNLVITHRVNNNGSPHYLITIFNGTGKQVVNDQVLTDLDLSVELDTVLEFRELGRGITSSLGYIHPELDRLIEKKWLEKMEPPGDRLYVNPKEDRQPLNDWAMETLLDPQLAELSLALVSPGEEVDFNPEIEVREGWLLLQSRLSEAKK